MRSGHAESRISRSADPKYGLLHPGNGVAACHSRLVESNDIFDGYFARIFPKQLGPNTFAYENRYFSRFGSFVMKCPTNVLIYSLVPNKLV